MRSQQPRWLSEPAPLKAPNQPLNLVISPGYRGLTLCQSGCILAQSGLTILTILPYRLVDLVVMVVQPWATVWVIVGRGDSTVGHGGKRVWVGDGAQKKSGLVIHG